MTKIESWELKQRQGLDLDAKILMSSRRIREWYDEYHGKVYVAFSGGKDSTVLLHLVRSIFPDVEAVFVDTGLEYPEIRSFVATISNVTTIRPKKSFKQVLDEYGYPVISKRVARYIRDMQNPTAHNKKTRDLRMGKIANRSSLSLLPNKWKYLVDSPFKISDKCCDIMKKEPIHDYVKRTGKKAYLGVMASDSLQRQFAYLKSGCFNHEKGICSPIAFWTENDIWEYIKRFKLAYCSIYDTGVKRTGCMFCMFGVHIEKRPNRFELMKKTHPQLYSYCIKKLGIGKVLDYIGVEYGNQCDLCGIVGENGKVREK